jgi:hypothetical protein
MFAEPSETGLQQTVNSPTTAAYLRAILSLCKSTSLYMYTPAYFTFDLKYFFLKKFVANMCPFKQKIFG